MSRNRLNNVKFELLDEYLKYFAVCIRYGGMGIENQLSSSGEPVPNSLIHQNHMPLRLLILACFSDSFFAHRKTSLHVRFWKLAERKKRSKV